MSSSSIFLASPGDEADQVLDWFRALDDPPEETATPYGTVLFFRSFGELAYFSDTPVEDRLTKKYRVAQITGATIDAECSPLVQIVLPTVKRGILWTAGEVLFTPTPLRQQFPKLDRIKARFLRWLRSQELVFESHPKGLHEWDYYLEGSLRSTSEQIYAFAEGLSALKGGRYFVAYRDNRLESLCRALRLRGVDCGADEA